MFAYTLGHATNLDVKTIQAELHLNSKRKWLLKEYYTENDNSCGNDNIFETLIHEIGHNLGLDHNMNTNSVMYPYALKKYFKSFDEFKLPQVDIDNIRSLYKIEENNSTQIAVVKDNINNNNDTNIINNNNNISHYCTVEHQLSKFVVVGNSKILIIYENLVWIHNLKTEMYVTPLDTNKLFPYLKYKYILGAYQKPNTNLVFITEDILYEIKWPTMEMVYKITLSNIIPNFQEAKTIFKTNLGKIYIIYNKLFLAEINDFNYIVEKIVIMDSVFKGVLGHFDGVFSYIDGYIYIINDGFVYQYSEFYEQIIKFQKFSLSMFNIFCIQSESILINKIKLLLNEYDKNNVT